VSTGIQRWRVPLGFAAAAVLIITARPHLMSLLVGLPLAVLGLAVRASAAGHIRKNEVLATTGPYRFTRNPLYLGSAILALGLVVAADSWLLAVIALAMLIGVYLPVIRREEQYLSQRFGADFDAYAARVPRLWPRWPWHASRRPSEATWRCHEQSGATSGSAARAPSVEARPQATSGSDPAKRGEPPAGKRFSLDLYLKHREYHALLGFLVIALVLIAKWWLAPIAAPGLAGGLAGW